MKRNHGSATIEMTMLISLIMGIIYLFIMYLLFSMGLAKNMEEETIKLYEQDKQEKTEVSLGDGQLRYNVFHNSDFQIKIEMKKEKENPVAFIRRWQLVSRTVS